jgi:glycosyltransferase involved in cell wall biosynthesis
MYYHLHNLSDAIILYSENEKKYIRNKNHFKTFIANNTLNLEDLSFERDIERDKVFVKEKYNLESENNILFVGRITKNKEIDVLLSCFKNTKAEVVLVGPGLNENLRKVVDNTPNYHYLGEIYDREELSALFNTSKLFCIPGNLGLALIEALYWGQPTITLDGANTPEIIYLKDGKNGYIVKNKEELEKKALELLTNKELYLKFSENARDTFLNEAHISKMFQGFLDAVYFCSK